LRNAEKPDRLRFAAAKACADFHYPTLKAVAQVSRNDMASVIEASRARAAMVANVIQMKVAPPKALQHSPEELKPDPSRNAATQSPSGPADRPIKAW